MVIRSFTEVSSRLSNVKGILTNPWTTVTFMVSDEERQPNAEWNLITAMKKFNRYVRNLVLFAKKDSSV